MKNKGLGIGKSQKTIKIHLIRARTAKAIVPRSHPVWANALGKARAPAPTIRLKTQIEAI